MLRLVPGTAQEFLYWPALIRTERPVVPATIPHGESLHDELRLLVEAGLSTVDALRAATSLSAKHFGLHDRGVVAPGRRADLVLLTADPTEDIQNTRKIKQVWCGGIPCIQ